MTVINGGGVGSQLWSTCRKTMRGVLINVGFCSGRKKRWPYERGGRNAKGVRGGGGGGG